MSWTTRVLTVERLARAVLPSFCVPSSFFEGLFWRCDDPDFPPGVHRDACGIDAVSGAPNGYRWVNAPMLHYDSIGHAMLSTFVISSGGWEELLADALAMTELDHQPREKSSIWAAAYFLFGVFSFGFFLKNLFIGVLQSTYLRHRSIEYRSAGSEVSSEDRRWGEFVRFGLCDSLCDTSSSLFETGTRSDTMIPPARISDATRIEKETSNDSARIRDVSSGDVF